MDKQKGVMKAYLYPVLRCVCVLAVGVLLVLYRAEWAQVLVLAAGAVFFVCGLVSVLMWLIRKGKTGQQTAEDATPAQKQKKGGFFPLLGIGSGLLGLLLMVGVKKFTPVFVYVVGAALVLLTVYQLVTLSRLRREVRIPGSLFLSPLVALLLALVALWNPMKAASLPFILVGLGCMVSAIGDVVALIMHAVRKKKSLPTLE